MSQRLTLSIAAALVAAGLAIPAANAAPLPPVGQTVHAAPATAVQPVHYWGWRRHHYYRPYYYRPAPFYRFGFRRW